MSSEDRAKLPGVSAARAGQPLAGAIVADAAFDLFDVDVADICPWALRGGVILRRIDHLALFGQPGGSDVAPDPDTHG